jgi:transcriptional regulator with XRE-family HTH domain
VKGCDGLVKSASLLPSVTFLGRELRHAREMAGMSQAQLAELVNYVPSFISMVETADRLPKQEFTEACDKALGTGGILTRLLTQLIARDGAPEWFWPWIEIEREATSLRAFEPLIVHGMLQTREYARAIFRSCQIGSDADVERSVEARLQRQEIMARENPPMIVVVMGEEALRRPVGGTQVMLGQLEHLLAVSEQRGNVRIQIVPLSVGEYSGLGGPFAIAEVGGTSEYVFVDDSLKGRVVQGSDHVANALQNWELIRSEALSQRQSSALIREVTKSWPSTGSSLHTAAAPAVSA